MNKLKDMLIVENNIIKSLVQVEHDGQTVPERLLVALEEHPDRDLLVSHLTYFLNHLLSYL